MLKDNLEMNRLQKANDILHASACEAWRGQLSMAQSMSTPLWQCGSPLGFLGWAQDCRKAADKEAQLDMDGHDTYASVTQ